MRPLFAHGSHSLGCSWFSPDSYKSGILHPGSEARTYLLGIPCSHWNAPTPAPQPTKSHLTMPLVLRLLLSLSLFHVIPWCNLHRFLHSIPSSFLIQPGSQVTVLRHAIRHLVMMVFPKQCSWSLWATRCWPVAENLHKGNVCDFKAPLHDHLHLLLYNICIVVEFLSCFP